MFLKCRPNEDLKAAINENICAMCCINYALISAQESAFFQRRRKEGARP